MGDDQAWPEVPGLDDWYDNAIKAGQGFKSDKEREDYIKSIGDPMMHPLFAECTEDLVGNPLAEGLRLLREEDKTPIEIAIMYKDEGNEWLKKGDKKSLNEAYDRYSHALSILDRTVSAAVSGASSFNAATGVTSPSNAMSPNESIVPSLYPLEVTQRKDEEKDLTNDEKRKADAEENLLRSQILSNRALVSLTLLNHGSCIRDTEAALKCWSGNVKAHYRKCKSLVALRKYEEGLVACAEGLAVEPENTQILQLKSKCDKELLSIRTSQNEISAKLVIKENHWRAAWDIMSATGSLEEGKKGAGMIGVGYASAGQNPAQLQETLPHHVTESPGDSASVGWPVLLLYPQYSQIDVIQGVTATDMLAIHLAEMFPELADLDSSSEGGCAVPWDRDREYHVSRLAVYAPLEAVPRISTAEQWMLFCKEQSAIRGEMGAEACEVATEVSRKRSEAYERSLLNSKSKAGSFLDIHLGSTFQTIMRAPGHVLAGGLLTLLVFVRGNEAHSNFLRDVSKRGSHVWSLSPTGSIERAPL